MKPGIFPLLLGILTLGCHLPLAGDSRVPFYLQPVVSARPAGEIKADDPLLAAAQPLDGQPAGSEPWYWVERPGTYSGFVENTRIGKNLRVRPGTVVRLRPDRESPVLTTVEEGDPTEVLWTGDWWEIQFTKAVPVYFQQPAVPAVVAPLPPPAQMSAESPPPAPAAVRPEASPRASAPPPPPPPPVESRPAVVPPVGTGSGERLSVDVEGYFRRSSPRLLVPAPQPYELVNVDGERLAYVDIGPMVGPWPVSDFLDTWVVVHGTKERSPRLGDVILRARTIRPR